MERRSPDPAFTRQYFAGFAIDVEPKARGCVILFRLIPTGAFHISTDGWSNRRPPRRRFSCTWLVAGMPDFRRAPGVAW